MKWQGIAGSEVNRIAALTARRERRGGEGEGRRERDALPANCSEVEEPRAS